MTADTLRPERFTKTLDALYASPRAKKLDYLSLNVYEPFGGPRRDPRDTDRGIPWDTYMMDGEVYRTFILAKNDFNADLPVYMGENSCANFQPIGEAAIPRPDGWTRERYLKTYLMEMIRCMKEGVPIRGYLYWTLVDDVQPPRLGLYNYDFVEPSDPRHGWLRTAVRRDLRPLGRGAPQRGQGHDLGGLRQGSRADPS